MTGKKAAVQAQQKQSTPAPVVEKKPAGGYFEGAEQTGGGTFLGGNQNNPNLTRARFLGI